MATSYLRLLGDPQVGGIATPPLHCRWSPTKGIKSELAASPLPSRGPTSGHNYYVTPACSGVPNKGDKFRIATSPLPSRGPTSGRNCYITPTFSGVPNKGRTNSELATSYLRLLGDPQVGGIATPPLHCRWSPTKGTKSELAASPLPSRGPTSGLNYYVTPAFSGFPNKGDKFRIATSPLPSRGPTSGRNCYITPTFSGSQQRGQIQNWLPHTFAFSGTHKWAELLHYPCIVGGPFVACVEKQP